MTTMLTRTQMVDSLDQLLGRIIDLDERKIDLIGDTRRMSYEALADFSEEGDLVGVDHLITVDADEQTETFDLNSYATGQLATDLNIPKRYFDRMTNSARNLLETNVRHWLYEEPKRRMIRGYRQKLGDGDGLGEQVGRAWLSDSYRRLDHIQIARQLLPEFENLDTEVQFHQAAVTDERLYIRAVFPQMLKEVKVGDAVQWGIELRNSEVGAGMLAISGFVNRLSCINGMTVTRELARRHVGRRIDDEGILSQEALMADDVAYWLAARDVLRHSITETRFEQVVEQLRETLEGETVQHPIGATEVLANRFGLTADEKESVLTQLVSGGDMTRWGALNAVTAAAKTAEGFDRQAEMESYGWAMVGMTDREWNTIARAKAKR
jgi:hypothetical protein